MVYCFNSFNSVNLAILSQVTKLIFVHIFIPWGKSVAEIEHCYYWTFVWSLSISISHQISDFSVPDIPADNVKIILAVVKYQNKLHCTIDTNQNSLQCPFSKLFCSVLILASSISQIICTNGQISILQSMILILETPQNRCGDYKSSRNLRCSPYMLLRLWLKT